MAAIPNIIQPVHPKNPFAQDYDFDTLIKQHTPLSEFVFVNKYENKSIKFSDQQAVKALNCALLKVHYGLTYWDIPEDNLCPPVPGRLDYLLHIADLIPKSDIRLLDIGTGANLIYPILATCHFGWECTASEVDKASLKNAQEIIDKNDKLSKIELRPQQFKNSILENTPCETCKNIRRTWSSTLLVDNCNHFGFSYSVTGYS